MRIEEEYKKSGYFWLPENPDRKIPGTLTISNGGKIELEVVGLFDERFEALNGDDNLLLNRIIGHIEKDGLVTLDNCRYTQKNFSFGGISKSLIYAKLLLSGVEYEINEVVTFNTLSFSVDCIDAWIGVSGLEIVTDYARQTATINYTHPSNFSYSLNNGMTLEICFVCTLPNPSNFTNAQITQRAYFKLISEELRSLSDFTKIAYLITNLLNFAIDTTVSLKNISATSSEILFDSQPAPISIYYESISFPEKEPNVNWHQMLFTFQTIKDNAESIFNNWINAYDSLAPAFGLYFSTKIGAQKYLDGKFLALIQGLETYHRRTSSETLMDSSEFTELVNSILKHCPSEKLPWLEGRLMHGNEINLGKRIKKIIEPFKEHIGNSSERSKIIRKIVDTRNYLTHFSEALKPEAARGRDLLILCVKMEAIFQLHIMKIIGLTDEEVSNVVENSYLLKQKLEFV